MRLPGIKHFPSTSLQEHTCTIVLVQMHYHPCISLYRAAVLVPHMYAHRMLIWPHKRGFSPHTCQSEMGIFQVCNYTLWVQADKITRLAPQHPNLTLPAHPVSTGNKAKPFRQIWNRHIQTFCLSHLGTTNGFSSYRRLKIYAYLHQCPLSLSQYYIYFASHKVLRYLPLLPPATNLSVSSWQRGPEAMFPCHLSHVAWWHCFWNSACSACIFYRKPLSFLKQWIIHLLLYYCKRFVTLETECNMQFITVHGDARRLCSLCLCH